MGRQQYINKCMEEAEKSTVNFKHGAIIIKNNKVVSRGYNKYTGHQQHHLRTVHAEMNAIQNAGKNCENSTLYVIRLSNLTDDGLGCSCPCHKCAKFMKLHKIQKVVYSTGDEINKLEAKLVNDLGS